jgi:hypothetical protein
MRSNDFEMRYSVILVCSNKDNMTTVFNVLNINLQSTCGSLFFGANSLLATKITINLSESHFFGLTQRPEPLSSLKTIKSLIAL